MSLFADTAVARVRELSEALAAMEKERDDALVRITLLENLLIVSNRQTQQAEASTRSHRHRCPNSVHYGSPERECSIMMCVPGIAGNVTEKECYPCHARISAPRPVVG